MAGIQPLIPPDYQAPADINHSIRETMHETAPPPSTPPNEGDEKLLTVQEWMEERAAVRRGVVVVVGEGAGWEGSAASPSPKPDD